MNLADEYARPIIVCPGSSRPAAWLRAIRSQEATSSDVGEVDSSRESPLT